MSRAIYVLIFLMAINLVITIVDFLNQSATSPQTVYVPAAADKTSSDTVVPAVPTIAVKLPDDKILRDMIQTVLKQELDPYLHQIASNRTPEVVPNAVQVKSNTSANREALEQSTIIVDSAIATGSMTSQQSAELGAYANQLTMEQRAQLMEKIGRAVNEQRLDLRGSIPAL